MQTVELNVTKNGDVYEAKASGWPVIGRGPTFKEAIGEWVYINAMGTNVKIDGPIFHNVAPNTTAAKPCRQASFDESLHNEVVEVVTGLHRTLSKLISAHCPDSTDAEWLSHSNELVRKLTGNDVPPAKFNYAAQG